MTTQTPRTDEALNVGDGSMAGHINRLHAVQTLCETLERELSAANERLAQLERGEYICKECGLRKDGEHEKGDF